MRQNFDRPAGARFAFIMSIPIMFAADSILVRLAVFPQSPQLLPVFIPGFITAGSLDTL
jgi:undecaprenyl pyrophosphate phosphatase UppP